MLSSKQFCPNKIFTKNFIKQIIKCDGLPFEVRNPRPNKELLDALKEGDDILLLRKNTKKYDSVKNLIEDLDSEV